MTTGCIHPEHDRSADWCDCPCCLETEVCENHYLYRKDTTDIHNIYGDSGTLER
jgi:hypothetical protein